MRKKETRRRGRRVGRGRSIVVQYLSNDIRVCSSFILANETMIFFLFFIISIVSSQAIAFYKYLPLH